MALGNLQWTPTSGGLQFEVKIRMSNISYPVVFFGFTNEVSTLQMPFGLTGTTLTAIPANACGLLYDSAATPVGGNIQWYGVGVKASVLAASANTGFYPITSTWEVYRIQIDESGNATFYRNGVLVGTVTNAITASSSYVPVVAAFSRTTSSLTVDVDYVVVSETRA
jgi:hypothetical protein